MIFEQAIDLIIAYVDKTHDGNVAAAARAMDVKAAALYRWYRRERTPNGEDLGKMLDVMGACLLPPQAAEPREVCFVDAKLVPAGENLPPPDCEDYFAVPLVEEVGAGQGIIAQGELISWLLVWRWQESIRHRSNLIAVRLAKGADSMIPILHPGDIVLIDRGERNVQTNGRMWLAIDPLDGSSKIKRVNAKFLEDLKDTRITFYSDNPDYPPEVYSLRADFLGDWDRAIAGRVIWAWSDVSNK